MPYDRVSRKGALGAAGTGKYDVAIAEVPYTHSSERKIPVVADHIGSFVGDSSHCFAFGAPSPAGKKLVL